MNAYPTLDRQMNSMVTHLRHATEAPCLLIAATNDAAVETKVANGLRRRLGGQFAYLDFTFTPKTLNLPSYLAALPPPGRPAILYAFGLDDLPPRERQRAIRALNLGRETLVRVPYSLVLWVRPATLGELPFQAGDFWAWRSGTYLFDRALSGVAPEPIPTAAEATRLRRQAKEYEEYLRSAHLSAPLRARFRGELDAVRRQISGYELRLAADEQKTVSPDLGTLRRRYLTYLADTYRWLEFSGIMQVRDVPRLPMADVFVPLKVTPPAQLRPERALLEAERIEDKVPLQELLPRYPRLAVLGDPGSGKTTFLKYVALALAQGPATARDRLGLEADLLPIILPISAYAEALRREPYLSLSGFLPLYFASLDLPGLVALFDDALSAGRALLLLDGLDEVASLSERERIVRRVETFTQQQAANHFVVTSRIAGYDQARLKSDEFTHLTIQPFDDEDIARFARQWCHAYETRGEAVSAAAKARAEARADRLIADIHSDPNIAKLAANPLLLSILALIHYQGAQLPRRRVELYRLCVKTLAETWNLARGLGDRPINLYLGGEPLDERFVVDVLGPVAYWMHGHCPERVIERRDLEEQLTERLAEYAQVGRLKARGLADDFIELMVKKTGLLAPRGLDLFGFLHLTFEEYLAARYLTDWLDYAAEAPRLAADPRWWEVVRLGTAALTGRRVGQLVGAVLDAGLGGENRGRDVVLASWCAVDAGRAAVGQAVMKHLLPRLEQTMRGTDDDGHPFDWAQGRPFDPPRVPAPTRAEAGRALADLGWLPADLDEMVDVPAGDFLMGSAAGEIERLKAEAPSYMHSWFDDEAPQRRVYVPAFHIAKYPVTNAQFGRFMDDGGYENETYWSPEGLAWLRRAAEEEAGLPSYRQRAGRTEPGYWRDAHFNRPNAPVVGVTWYEAEAYCRWLSARPESGGRDYRLPTEAMWEKTARGGLEIPLVGANGRSPLLTNRGSPLRENPNPQRRYPWGDDFDPERANTGEGDIGQPTAVGAYPLGASPYGVQDMVGNVWEWCADWFGPYQDPHERLDTGRYRLLRGGAWYDNPWGTRCACRVRSNPDYWIGNVGFRVAEYL